MEPHSVSPPVPSEESAATPTGELVVQNGRLRGTRRALAPALTLIGRDPACDFHINVDGVRPLHCAVVRGPTGFLLRDLGGDGGTFLNGNAISESPLQEGDVLSVGPFQFSVHLPEEEAVFDPEALAAERDALRVQAAAVAAQQAALAEEEGQLAQRRKAMQRQKDQLAAHLDERRRELTALREQVRQDRAALKADTEAARRQNDELRAALAREREEVQKELRQAGTERRRLVELRKRLKKRWRKHWQAHETALQRREQELKAERGKVEREAEELKRERVRLTQDRLRFNGEVELGRRHLQDEWQQLGLAQQQWEACLNQEQTERARRLGELDRRAAALAAAEQAVTEHRRRAEELQLNLRKEAEGLEVRIQNHRLKLLECEQQLSEARARPAAEEPHAVVLRPRDPDVPRVLARLADDLADHRRHLLEQWQTLLELYHAWEPERSAILGQFEAAARELVLTEQRLGARAQALAAGEEELRRRQQAVGEVRCALEAWQARLTARETFLDNERVMLLADVRAREERAEAQARRLEEMRQRRLRRRSQEIEEVRVARSRCEQTRRDYALLWQECQERLAELLRGQRELAAKASAVEQLRQELIGRAADTASADKRVERLARRNLARLEAEERDRRRERAALLAETRRLDRRAARLLQREQALVANHEEWMKQVAEWEDRQAASADVEQHRQHELRHWQLLHEQDQRQLAELREEVERIARLLLEEGETTTNAPLAA